MDKKYCTMHISCLPHNTKTLFSSGWQTTKSKSKPPRYVSQSKGKIFHWHTANITCNILQLNSNNYLATKMFIHCAFISQQCNSTDFSTSDIQLDISIYHVHNVDVQGTRHLPLKCRRMRQQLSGRGGCARGQTSCGMCLYCQLKWDLALGLCKHSHPCTRVDCLSQHLIPYILWLRCHVEASSASGQMSASVSQQQQQWWWAVSLSVVAQLSSRPGCCGSGLGTWRWPRRHGDTVG